MVVETVGGNRTIKVTNAPFEVYFLDRSEHITTEGALIVASIPGHKPTKSSMNKLVKWSHSNDVPMDSLDSAEILLLNGYDLPEAYLGVRPEFGWMEEPVRCENVTEVECLWT